MEKDDKIEVAHVDDWSVPQDVKANPLFVEIGNGNVVDRLKVLDQKMKQEGVGKLISSKINNGLFGRRLDAGRIAIWKVAGKPQVSLNPGRYLNFNFACSWFGSYDITSQIEQLGLTVCQVGQSEAMVVQDPQNRVFVIRNGGFVSYGAYGRFKILAVVDTLNLPQNTAVLEPGSNRILGYKHEVQSTVGDANVTVATFLNIPANNVALIQQGTKIFALKGGQHVLTNPSTTFRSFLSLGERQHAFRTQPAYTLEGVPVVLDLNLRYRIFDPVTLTQHYDEPLQALINPSQTIVNALVSRLSYQQFMRAQKVGGDVPDYHHTPWLETFKSGNFFIKSECIHELRALSQIHGIEVLAFDVMDRRLEGALGKDLEKNAEQVLQNQMEATQIELRNHINNEKQKGILAVQQVENENRRNQAETDYFIAQKQADAKYYQQIKEAEAKANTAALVAQQEAKNIITIAEAQKKQIALQTEALAQVPPGHAQNIQILEKEIEKRRAMPPGTVWFEGSTDPNFVSGYTTAKGVALANYSK
ncbi:hypothetical protein HDV04_004892 [Boothiomyces sp. JEL0838]|nr:hypothetical protein HDV04_004892 [Boothiomyces sp. JEL0838]